ncbi:MAG: CoA transferase, partial [Actinomycetota bacterium]|nr:CoA transferase [Actinomycetota bacterium]
FKSIVVDKPTAMTTATAALAAVIARSNGAGGQHIQISLLESILAWLWPDVYWNHALPDAEPVPTYSIWYAPYDTADGQISAVWVSYEHFQNAARALGRPDLAEDVRFASRGSRLRHSLVMRAEFAAALKDFTTEQALAALRAADVPSAPVLALDDVFDDPQVIHTGIIVEELHPTAGRIVTTRPPAHFSKTPTAITRPAPGRGQHSDEILAAIGYEPADVAAMREAGVVI